MSLKFANFVKFQTSAEESKECDEPSRRTSPPPSDETEVVLAATATAEDEEQIRRNAHQCAEPTRSPERPNS